MRAWASRVVHTLLKMGCYCSTTMCQYWDKIMLNLLRSILTILLTCPNSNTLLCYSNDPFLAVYTSLSAYCFTQQIRVRYSVSPRAQSNSKRGGRIEKTTTSKGLMHSNDHIKENWATIEGGSTPYPPLGESLNIHYFAQQICFLLCIYMYMCVYIDRCIFSWHS